MGPIDLKIISTTLLWSSHPFSIQRSKIVSAHYPHVTAHQIPAFSTSSVLDSFGKPDPPSNSHRTRFSKTRDQSSPRRPPPFEVGELASQLPYCRIGGICCELANGSDARHEGSTRGDNLGQGWWAGGDTYPRAWSQAWTLEWGTRLQAVREIESGPLNFIMGFFKWCVGEFLSVD